MPGLHPWLVDTAVAALPGGGRVERFVGQILPAEVQEGFDPPGPGSGGNRGVDPVCRSLEARKRLLNGRFGGRCRRCIAKLGTARGRMPDGQAHEEFRDRIVAPRARTSCQPASTLELGWAIARTQRLDPPILRRTVRSRMPRKLPPAAPGRSQRPRRLRG